MSQYKMAAKNFQAASNRASSNNVFGSKIDCLDDIGKLIAIALGG